MKSTAYEDIAFALKTKYNYYDTIYFEFIVDAVKDTITDFKGEVKSLEEVHKHIIENYI